MHVHYGGITYRGPEVVFMYIEVLNVLTSHSVLCGESKSINVSTSRVHYRKSNLNSKICHSLNYFSPRTLGRILV